VDERRQYRIFVYDDFLFVAEGASKKHGHVNTYHHSTSSVGLEIYSSAVEVSITGVLAPCAA